MTNSAQPITTVRIAQETPVIFIDTIHSHSFAFGISKLLLSRWDPAHDGVSPPTQAIVAQIVMPTENLIRSIAFLEHRLKLMVESNAITQAQIDQARKLFDDQADKPGNAAG
jgi:hypothetical protein